METQTSIEYQLSNKNDFRAYAILIELQNYPYVEDYSDICESSDHKHYIMKVKNYETALEHLEKCKTDLKLYKLEVAKLILQVAYAIKFLHSKGIYYRSIKIDNIKYNSETGNYVLSNLPGRSKKKAQGDRAGGTSFSVADGWTSTSHIDTVADIYGFGVLLYYFLPLCNDEFPPIQITDFSSLRDKDNLFLIETPVKDYNSLMTVCLAYQAVEEDPKCFFIQICHYLANIDLFGISPTDKEKIINDIQQQELELYQKGSPTIVPILSFNHESEFQADILKLLSKNQDEYFAEFNKFECLASQNKQYQLLGLCYEYGVFVLEDWFKAYKYYEKCENKNIIQSFENRIKDTPFGQGVIHECKNEIAEAIKSYSLGLTSNKKDDHCYTRFFYLYRHIPKARQQFMNTFTIYLPWSKYLLYYIPYILFVDGANFPHYVTALVFAYQNRQTLLYNKSQDIFIQKLFTTVFLHEDFKEPLDDIIQHILNIFYNKGAIFLDFRSKKFITELYESICDQFDNNQLKEAYYIHQIKESKL